MNSASRINVTCLILLLLICVGSGCGFLFNDDKGPLHIALVGPMTGVHESVGRSFRQGINLYLDMINKKGGVNGRKIILDVYDDQNNPQKAREKAFEIVEDHEALGVIGHHYSDSSISAGEIYKEFGVPAITPASSNIKVTEDNEWYFRTAFNDNAQGRFLANYAKKVLGQSAVSVIHEDQAYGAYLAEIFIKAARERDVDVKYVWEFELNDEDLDQTLRRIVSELSIRNDAGVVFIATHAPEGIKILKLMKDYFIQNPLMGPDAFASKAFQEGFKIYPKEKKNPGYYTDGMYITTPLIYDTTTEKGQQFKAAYQKAYNEKPGWHSAFAYDSVMVLVEALKNAGITGKEDALKSDREKIKNYLAGLLSINDAIEGATGLNYFDEEGNSQKQIFVGVYKNQNIISALTQFQAIPNIGEIPDFEEARRQGRVLLFDGRYMYRINVVYTGIMVNEISDLDIENATCALDFFIWFRYRGGIDVRQTEFLNAVEDVELGAPVQEKITDQLSYSLFRVKQTFKMDFLPSQYAFGQHVLGVSIRHRLLDRNNLIFVNDVLGMGLAAEESPLNKIRGDNVLSPKTGWKIGRAWFSQNTAEKDAMGDPAYLHKEAATIKFSRFNMGMLIVSNEFSFKSLIPNRYMAHILIFSLLLTMFLSLSVRGRVVKPIPNLRAYSKSVWVFQCLFAFLLLLAGEAYMLDRFSDKLSPENLENIITAFQIAWWIVPAHLLNMGVNRFIWTPLEEHTQRPVPNLIRHLCTILIFMLAVFGVTAFVFHQKLTSLLATSGVIAMIVGLAIQVNISNVFSGIAINLERPFRMGDWVKIGDYSEGKVIDINWRATRVLTRDATVISIPNSQASESSIENFSYPTAGYFKYFTIHVEPHHSPERVKKVLLNAAMATEGVENDPPPATRFLGLTAGMTGQSESWAANYLISTFWKDYGMKFAHNEAIWLNVWSHLRHAGIRHIITRQDVSMVFQGIAPKKEKMSNALAVLKEMDIFRPFPEEAKRHLSERMKSYWYPSGEMLVRQGDAGDSLFIIVEGVLGVWTKTEDGRSIEIARLGAGNFFGEMALLTGEPRTATVVAITDATLFEITKEDIFPIIEKRSDITWAISEVLSERKMATEDKMTQQQTEEIDKESLSTQILGKIQEFFGFKKS